MPGPKNPNSLVSQQNEISSVSIYPLQQGHILGRDSENPDDLPILFAF